MHRNRGTVWAANTFEMEQSTSPASFETNVETQIHDLILEALNYDDHGMPLVLQIKKGCNKLCV